MTKVEKSKCEKLIDEALRSARRSILYYEEYEVLKGQSGKEVDTLVRLRQSDQNSGYAEGIHQALAMLNYDGERMEELAEAIGI